MWHDPLTWTVASVIAYALATNVHWATHAATRRPGVLADAVAWFDKAPRAGVVAGVYLFGVPAVALALRVASPAQLGLQAPRSVSGVVVAVCIAAVAIVLLFWSRNSLLRATGENWRWPSPGHASQQLGGLALRALLLEAHWALFRAGGLSAASAVTTGVFLGLGLLATEAWSNPWRRMEFRDPVAVHHLAVTGVLAVNSALAFVATGSSLVSLVLHIVVAVAALWLPLSERRARTA